MSHASLLRSAHRASRARDGLSNPEIGGRLSISARTVKHHLSKVHTKLSITRREQLERVLPVETATGSR